MGKVDSLTISLHGVICRLEADQPAFLDFARRHLFGLFEFENEPGPGLHSEAGVVARLHWDAAPSSDWRHGTERQWGRRIFQSGARLLQSEVLPLPGLQLEAGWMSATKPAGDVLRLEAYYQPASRLQRFAQRMGLTAEVHHALIYYLVYFPLIYILGQTRGCYLLHAAAVTYPSGASSLAGATQPAETSPAPGPGWLLAGLPGSGKTTFALSLLANPQARLLSDNLVLFDERRVYALPESIHLSGSSRAKLSPAVQDMMQDTGYGKGSYARGEYRLPPAARRAQAIPQALFFIGLRATELAGATEPAGETHCAPLAPAAALRRLLAFDHLSKEMAAYSQFAAALDLISPGGGESCRRSTLERLVSSLACFELWLRRNAPLEETAMKVEMLASQMLASGMQAPMLQTPEAGTPQKYG